MEHFTVLFEDSEILLINKKYGICVQGGAGVSHSLDEELSKQCGYKIHLVHRLDKDTEGILVVAKNAQAAAKWTRLIGEKSAKKEYYAWCAGIPQINGRECKNGKLVSNIEQHGRKVSAELFYDIIEEKKISLEEKELTVFLVHIVLGTGRLHQIRIQFAKAGAPLLADDQHGDFKLNKLLRKAGIKKLQLCAKRLTLPLNGKERTFEIDLPSHFF